MTAALAYNDEPREEDRFVDDQSSLIEDYRRYFTTVDLHGQPPTNHAPEAYWKPSPKQELFLKNPTWEVFYGGQGGGGKALALTTPIPTPSGWTTMGALHVGDVVFDEHGKPCRVTFATDTMHGHDVYDVVFDDGSVIRADAEHWWFTITVDDIFTDSQGAIRTTDEIRADLAKGVHHAITIHCRPDVVAENHITLTPSDKRKHSRRIITAIVAVPTEPVRCIQVDSPSHLYLAGQTFIPTHNTDALLIDAAAMMGNKHHRALLLRRSYVDLTRYIIPRSRQLYEPLGARWRASERRWYFPSGATVELGACDHEEAIHKFAGAAYNWIGYDELTHFTFRQYTFLFSRLRSAAGLPLYIRAASNPGGPGHDWVFERFGAWLNRLPDGSWNDQYEGVRGEYGKPLFFLNDAEGVEQIVPKGTKLALGRTFIPATVYDNPFLASSGYIASMNAMSKLDRARIMHGDWLAKPGRGVIFEGKWFKNPDVELGDPERPTNVVARLRYWDLAGTEQARAKEGTAYTAGIRMSAEVIGRGIDGTPLVRVWIEDIIRGQWHPAGVIQTVEETMKSDQEFDRTCLTYVERDPGQAGTMQSWFMSTSAAAKGFHLRPVPPQGDKVSRARIPSAHAEQGNVWLMPAKWNKPFREELQDFPEALKDQVDSFTGGFRQLLMLARNVSGGAKKPAADSPAKNIRKGGF